MTDWLTYWNKYEGMLGLITDGYEVEHGLMQFKVSHMHCYIGHSIRRWVGLVMAQFDVYDNGNHEMRI